MLLAFVRGIYQLLMNSLHKGPVTWKMFPFDDIIMILMKLIFITISSAHVSDKLFIVSFCNKQFPYKGGI